ncbi:MAG: response regulator [Lentisphaerae bacterium]|nr:response regulator [Lentisphaerota bacterium]
MIKQDDVTPLDRRRILVVDDSRGIRELFRIILESALPEREIDTATNGREAVDEFSARHHAVLLLDLNMPVMDGETAFLEIDRLCRNRRWLMPTVVFCTGYAPPDVVRALVENGSPHRFLEKPVSEDELIGVVRDCLKA